MKRGIIAIVLFVLLISSFAIVIAPEDDQANPSDDKNNNLNISAKAGEVGAGVKAAAEGVLEKEIEIPDALQIPVRIVFGIKKDETITLERLIVLVAVWIMFFVLISEILKIAPILNKQWQSYIGGVIVTILIAITGTMNSLAIFFFNFGNMFEWMEKLGPFSIFISLIIVAMIFFFGMKILKLFEDRLKLSKAQETGESIGRLGAIAKVAEESMEELTE